MTARKFFSKKNKTTRFSSVPDAKLLIPLWIVPLPVFIYGVIDSSRTGQNGAIPLLILIIVVDIIALFFSIRNAIAYIELKEQHLECKVLFQKKIIMKYDSCAVGMDYSVIRGRKLWWIYLCYGQLPKYPLNNPQNRINALKCKQGFVRIVYREDVYNALVDTLPKKQRNALISSQRFVDR